MVSKMDVNERIPENWELVCLWLPLEGRGVRWRQAGPQGTKVNTESAVFGKERSPWSWCFPKSSGSKGLVTLNFSKSVRQIADTLGNY